MKNVIIRTAMVGNRDMAIFHKNLGSTIEDMQNDENVQDVEVQYRMELAYFSALILGRMKVEDK